LLLDVSGTSGTSLAVVTCVRTGIRPMVSRGVPPRFSGRARMVLRAVTRIPKARTLKQRARARALAHYANKNKTFRKQRRRYDNEPVDVDLELVGNSFPSRGEREKNR